MNKKNMKKKRSKELLLRELVLLVPAHSFMYQQMEELSEKDKLTRDYDLSVIIVKKVSSTVGVYKVLHEEALHMWERIENKLEVGKFNIFLLGLCLLANHLELKNRKINLGVTDEILELQDLCYAFFDKDDINRHISYADNVKDELLKLNN